MYVHLKDRQTVRVNNGDYFILSTTPVQLVLLEGRQEREKSSLEKRHGGLFLVCVFERNDYWAPWAIPVIYSPSTWRLFSIYPALLLLAKCCPHSVFNFTAAVKFANAKWNF